MRRQIRHHLASEFIERCHFIGRAYRDCLARHTEYDAACLILRKIISAGIFHFQHAERTILAHAGEDNADRVLSSRYGSRAEQHVDRRSMAVDRRPLIELRHVVGTATSQRQMRMAWCDIGMPRQDTFAAFCLVD